MSEEIIVTETNDGKMLAVLAPATLTSLEPIREALRETAATVPDASVSAPMFAKGEAKWSLGFVTFGRELSAREHAHALAALRKELRKRGFVVQA